MAAKITIAINQTVTGNGIEQTRRELGDLDQAVRNTGDGFTVGKGLMVNALSAIAAKAVEAAGAVVQFGKDAVGAAQTFESAVNNLAAVSGDSLNKAGFNLEDVSQKALQLGKDTQFSAQQAISAMTELVKGGVPVADVMGQATDATLALAAAAGVGLAPAAEIVAKQLGVWGKTGVTAAQVTDLIAGAANASTVGVEDLALGLAQAGGTAKVAGLSFEDMVQSIALIAPNFSSAADAGTSFKTFVSRLTPTTDKAKETMIELGLATADGASKFFDAQGNFIGMAEAAALLKDATKDLSQEQRLQAFNTLFGSDAIRAAAAVAEAGAEGFNEMGQAIADSGGATAAATIKQQGLEFALEQLSGSMDTLKITIGTVLLPVITPLIEQTTAALNVVLEFATAFGKLIPAITSSDNPLRTFFNALRIATDDSLNPAIAAVEQFVMGAMAQLAPIVEGGRAALEALAPVFVQLQSDATAAGAMLQQGFNAALPVLQQWGAAIATTAVALFNTLLPAVNAVAAFVRDPLLPALVELGTWLLSLLPGAIAGLAAIWQGVLVPVLGVVVDVFTTMLLPALAQLVNWLRDVLPPVVASLTAFWQNELGPVLAGVGKLFIEVIIPAVIDLANFIGTMLAPELDKAKRLFNGLLGAAKAFWEGLQTWLLPIIVTIKANIMIFKGVLDEAKNGFSNWIPVIKGVIDFIKKLADAIRSLPPIPGVPGSGTGGSSSPPARALGGPVVAGETYLVGERGPELFRPQQSGMIVPNNQVVNNYNYAPVYGSAPSRAADDFALMRALAGAGT